VPSSLFIHLVRDGRAVVASLYEVTRAHSNVWGGTYTIERCIEEWNRAISAASAAMATGDDGIVIRYESLTTDPASAVRRLCEFLALPYEPQMLTTYSSLTSAIVTSDEQWKSRVREPIQDSGLKKYFQLFSSVQRAFIEHSLIPLPANLACK
jgi:LPS sulfotransferase NodH